MEELRLIEGGLVVDDRGQAMFVNDFHFENVKRFYVISNHQVGFIRAWHGHKRAAKYVLVIQGTALIGAVRIDNFEHPSKSTPPSRLVLSAQKPVVLYIPPGYANGAMTLTPDTKIMYFATDTLEETKNDDYRYDARYWDVWKIEER
ncbi:sugar epimerase [Candidatus Uhrbacteria bacterium RIFCSPLOWO2_01_FULL_47_24]|uniref:Sugar epimerase n=1 Tax=Candidatus Uhrbacteria bacterium RIFCSPLOWO2_01_FULL_47_24 TaxID=1802401 RepID=A0A1F7UTI3_9BACT|nr:MAG: sugar epimerase [Candidatus Uhrbacteria bacterium RIFCSPHIGHO2_01_FULL_47_11]OGL68770.1 MAG: sugar epimerase [Candidatus Uhrbacteria bacterium RIFCSPHIGHO2_02_FULL_46_47]OGL76801.1 MAG: sugar epimerase [Candidatus Uhrbacteria bacterium RIFCSPHIGHO2_12_FULL_47_11]OGL81575.1 MAG: sugar epimerase [Candidatus Uhrbacteria bacterium RIFCSPLOWO2_01_FULL_47_24]OGL83957.1 MAG: sugar epimerase [Candidatus Uhrbacteria bacterium RIFCSPLOWO2_02_FULL_46_25]OGL91586.1 MAG: sugar epimerase [Candidatus